MNDHSSGVSPSVSPNPYGVENIANAETQRQLIAAHRALSGIEHALQFAPRSAAISFCDMVWLLDGLGAVQLDGEPVWMQTVMDEPSHPGVQRAETYASIASSIAQSTQPHSLTRSTAMHIAERLSQNERRSLVTLRRDANSNETLQHGLAHWEHFVSDEGSSVDSLVLASIADAKFRRLSPFTANNHASAGLLFGALMRDEQVLSNAPLCLSNYFSRHSEKFYQALSDDNDVIRFYLLALTETAKELTNRLSILVSHIEHCRDVIDQTLSRAPIDVVLQAICRPICTNADLIEAGITRRQTSASYLKKLYSVGLLSCHSKGKELRYVNTGVLQAFSGLG